MSKTVDPFDTSHSTLKGEIASSRGYSVIAKACLRDAVRWWIDKVRKEYNIPDPPPVTNNKAMNWLNELAGSYHPNMLLNFLHDNAGKEYDRLVTWHHEEELSKITPQFFLPEEEWSEQVVAVIVGMYQSHLTDSFFPFETAERLFEKESVRWWIEKTRIENGWERGHRPLSWLDETVGACSYPPVTAWLLWAMEGERINSIQYEKELEKLTPKTDDECKWLDLLRNLIINLYQSHPDETTTPNFILDIKE